MKPLPKLMLFVSLIAGVLLSYRHLVATGKIPRPSILKSIIPTKADDITAQVLSNPGNVKPASLPSTKPVSPCQDGNTSHCIAGAVQEVEIWAWNANMGFLFAVGGGQTPDGHGIQTSKDSLMEKHHVNVTVRRQDDTTQMQADLLSSAQALSSDSNAAGVKFITIMGDGGAQFFEALNPKLKKLGDDYQTEVLGVLGYSRGEDGFWGPQEWKDSPQSAKGGLVIGVLRDGDWNIAMKWAAQNNVCNNPDEKTYDPNCLNWVNADSYTKAAEMLVSGYHDTRPIKGAFGGKTKEVSAQAVVTWTPGDVTIAHKKGGVVPIMTTRQSVFQMPCVLIGIRAWDRTHRDIINQMLAASFEGADQIRTNPDALMAASEISQAVYKEPGVDASYWAKYYRGVTEPDATGHRVPLGGSAVSNLADNLQAFGLSGGPNLFAATYNTFGKIDVQQYPNLVPAYPPVEDILDTSYVKAVQSTNALPTNNAETFKYTSAPISKVEGKRDYSIQFLSGSSQILVGSYPTLDQLADDVVVTKYTVAIHGYTDAAKWTGLDADASADKNMALSKARADSVRTYLQSKAPGAFPNERMRVYAHGQEDPVADNSSAAGRDKNRRVQIVLGVTE